jgi:integrase
MMKAYKLTPATVRRLVSEVPPEREATFADAALPRHFLRVRPPASPGQAWMAQTIIRYRLPGRPERKLKTGNPRTMSWEACQAAARLALAEVDAGHDPAAERAGLRDAWTLRDLWEAYQESDEFARFTPKVQVSVAGAFVNHILHHIGTERLAAITVPMVKRLISAISNDTRTNARHRRMGGRGCARKTTRILSSALTWSVGEGRIERNPVIGNLRLDGDGSRETVITEPAQYLELFETMARMVAAGELRNQARVFVMCSALTGMRRGELQALTWDQVDLGQRRITLTTSKGAKLARRGVKTETISLPPIAAAALAEIMPADAVPDERVFIPQHGKVLEINRDWTRIRAVAGLPLELTLHGLRHSIGTAAVLQGMSAPEVQKLLRHRNISTTAKYVHLAEATVARLQDRATAHLLPDPRPIAEVAKLPARRA